MSTDKPVKDARRKKRGRQRGRQATSEGSSQKPPHPNQPATGSLPESVPKSPSNSDTEKARERSVPKELKDMMKGLEEATEVLNFAVREVEAIRYDNIAMNARQGRVFLALACDIAHELDRKLKKAGRPKRCKLPRRIRAPNGRLVQLDANAAQLLHDKFKEAAARARAQTLDIDALESVAEVLGDVLRPIVQSFLARTLEFIVISEELSGKKVSDLSDEHRAAVMGAFRKVEALMSDNKVTVGSVIDLIKAINEAVESAGLSAIPIAPREEIPDKTMFFWYNPGEPPILLSSFFGPFIQKCEDGTLELDILKESVIVLNTAITGNALKFRR